MPPHPGYEGFEEFMFQISLWDKWIQWEKSDPLFLAKDDPKALRGRIIYVYKQALMAMRFYPRMWYEVAEYCFSAGIDDQATEFLKQGIAANPESCLLTFRYVERLEATLPPDNGVDVEHTRKRGQTVRKPYEDLLNHLYAQVTALEQRERDGIARVEEMWARHMENRRRPSNTDDDYGGDDEDDDDEAIAARQVQEKENEINRIKEDAKLRRSEMSKTISSSWINMMRTVRRVEGHGKVGDLTNSVGGSRQVFAEARKRGKLTSDVYAASALIEYHCYKDPAASKIFERGMKLFPEDENFALEYLKHLIAITDSVNARALFEMFVGRVAAPKARRVWQTYYEYVSQYGDLGEISQLEKRMREQFPDGKLL